MSASIIQPNALNPAHRQLLPHTGTRKQSTFAAPTSAALPQSASSSQKERAKANSRNRLYDLFTSFVAIVFCFCICATMVTLGGWLVYELFAEMSSWSSSDLIDVIKANNL